MTKTAIALQVVAIVFAVALESPSFIDRILQPTTCTGCLDFRGLDFVLWAVFFAPVALALMAAAWALRPSRIWPSWLALVVDLAVLGLFAYALLLGLTGHLGSNPSSPGVAVQVLQTLLVLASDLVSLVLVILLLNAAYGSSDDLLQLTRNVLIAQVIGMIACIALASPSLSDRLSSGYASATEGVAFVLWSVLLVPAGLVILMAAWRLHSQRTWPVLLPVLINLLVLGLLGLTGHAGFVNKIDPVQSGLLLTQIVVVVIPAVATIVMLAVFSRRRTKRGPVVGDYLSVR